MRYQFIQQHQGQFSLAALCRVMQVARSGYYAWCKRPKSAREQANQELTEQIKIAFEASDRTYGSPRLYRDLNAEGIACSQKRIARLMRLCHLKASSPRRFVATTDSAHALPVAQNILDRQFAVETPNARWTADITCLWTSEGWIYLAVILDLFSRRIVGWAMGTTLDRSLVLSALQMALSNRRPCSGLLCHSDRGSQYASGDYQKALQDNGIVCSMSPAGTMRLPKVSLPRSSGSVSTGTGSPPDRKQDRLSFAISKSGTTANDGIRR